MLYPERPQGPQGPLSTSTDGWKHRITNRTAWQAWSSIHARVLVIQAADLSVSTSPEHDLPYQLVTLREALTRGSKASVQQLAVSLAY